MAETRDWLSIFKAWECSHLSQTVFCERESIALKDFIYYRGKFLQQGLCKSLKGRQPKQSGTASQKNNHPLIKINLLQAEEIQKI